MLLNCDIGERGADHPVDRALMEYIDVANIACGGHAGDEERIAVFVQLAARYKVRCSAHLSYPDREHFGRRSLSLPIDDLLSSLDEQLDRLLQVKAVKFHGALYHDSAGQECLADALVLWLVRRGVEQLIAPPDSVIAHKAIDSGIRVLGEGFADRNYQLLEDDSLTLVDRKVSGSTLTFSLSLAQADKLSSGWIKVGGTQKRLSVQTLCVHSDTPHALELVKELKHRLPPFTFLEPGLCTFVTDAGFGQQHLGETPGGPQDRFSFQCGRRLLDQSRGFGVEWVLPPKIEIDRPALMILTGAETQGSLLIRESRSSPIPHAEVFAVEAGDILRLGKTTKGFRGQIMWRGADSESLQQVGQKRPLLKTFGGWRNSNGAIRIFPGPEQSWMSDPEELVSRPWKMSDQHSAMGIRLEPVAGGIGALNRTLQSAPVTDGTIQWSPSGPIVLMRHRQTVGGYPRVAQVCEVDIDRLAQFRPGDVLRFEWVNLLQARAFLELQKQSLKLI